jgi:hypothetical protein
MLRKLRPRSIYDVCAAMALFVALGGTAYAIDTIRSSDIVDNEVYSADVRNDDLPGGGLTSGDIANGAMTTLEIKDDNQPFGGLFAQDLAPGSVGTSEVANGSIGTGDIGSGGVGSDEVVNDSLLQSDIRANAVTNDEVLDNTLTGADINESSLSLPQTPTTATFASTGFTDLLDNDTFTKVVGKQLPAGSYAVTATANVDGPAVAGADFDRDTTCELRNGTGFIGGASDRRRTHDGAGRMKMSLSMNGGAQVPAGGGEVSLWCLYQGGGATIGSSQIMIIRLDGFF